MNKRMIFCTVNAGTNILTNITVKSILQLHPSSKIFVFDVCPNAPFTPIDQTVMANVEVVTGKNKKSISIPKIDETRFSTEELETIHSILKENEMQFIVSGDIQHSTNIQYMIDTIGENFILVDSDAPLIHSVDFDSYDVVTAGTFTFHPRLKRQLLFNPILYRITPFIQFFNVHEMLKSGLPYYNDFLLLNDLDTWYILNTNFYGKRINTLTGCSFTKQILSRKLKYMNINYEMYIDHFGAGTWDTMKDDEREKFYAKYQYLFPGHILTEEINDKG